MFVLSARGDPPVSLSQADAASEGRVCFQGRSVPNERVTAGLPERDEGDVKEEEMAARCERAAETLETPIRRGMRGAEHQAPGRIAFAATHAHVHASLHAFFFIRRVALLVQKQRDCARFTPLFFPFFHLFRRLGKRPRDGERKGARDAVRDAGSKKPKKHKGEKSKGGRALGK